MDDRNHWRLRFGEAIERWTPYLRGVLRNRGLPESELNDGIQIVAQRAITIRMRLRDPSPTRAWLAAIAVNVAHEYHNSAGKKMMALQEAPEWRMCWDAEAEMHQAITLQQLMSRLNPEDRKLVKLSFRTTHQQAARAFERPREWATRHLLRICRQLREQQMTDPE